LIAIVDYGMGNLRSVEKAFKKVGFDVIVTSKPERLKDAKGVVLPGVGAFRDCMLNLERLNLLDTILHIINEGKPYLGICLGLQILFSESEEFGASKGLDIIKGKVVRFKVNGLKVPHMGWNNVRFKKEISLFNQVPDNSYFYFVHSYYVVPEDPDVIAATTDYGVEFVSAVCKDNVVATQFHPEKSQRLGLQIIRNFAMMAEGKSLRELHQGSSLQ